MISSKASAYIDKNSDFSTHGLAVFGCVHTSSPSPNEKHGRRHEDGNSIDMNRLSIRIFQKALLALLPCASFISGNVDTQLRPEALSSRCNSTTPLGSAIPYRCLEEGQLLPTVDLDRTLLYNEDQQDLLARKSCGLCHLHSFARFFALFNNSCVYFT
jgi:hypothetical protein